MAAGPAWAAVEFVEAWNAHDPDRLLALHAPDYQGVDVARPHPLRGLEALRHSVEEDLAAFPDVRFSADEVVAQGDRLALSWTATGTHLGPLMRIPATGRRVQVRGICLLTLKGGKVHRAVSVWDVAGMLRALRLLPEL
jgi:steroid delta-isomerase-like uncharacterized protein